MLYAESIERASPLLSTEASTESAEASAHRSLISDRYRSPRIDLGLALGSSTFAVTLPGRSCRLPARVAIEKSSGKVVATGRLAAEMEGREAETIEVRRPVSQGIVVDQTLAGSLLRSALNQARHGLLTAPRIALAVPGDLSAVESQTLGATLESVGIRTIYMVDQTLASALGEGRDLLTPEGHLVVHLGAGVAQVSLCSLAHCLYVRTLRQGGDAMLAAVVDMVRKTHRLSIDPSAAEELIRELGTALAPSEHRTSTVAGLAIDEGKPAQREVSSQEVYEALKPQLDELADLVCRAVREMPIAMLPDVARNSILLTGGGARLDRLTEFLEQRTRLKVTLPEEPEHAVERGLQRILKEAKLRRALFLKTSVTSQGPSWDERAGTALLGLLMLTASLALASSSSAWLPGGVATAIERAVHPLVTPVAPPEQLWGWLPATVEESNESERDAAERLQNDLLAAENAELRRLLKAPARGYPKGALTADVVARDPRGWMSGITINLGREQGLVPGMIVTDGRALVGQVARVQAERSQVRLFTDTTAVAAARIAGGKGSGVIVGHGKSRVEMRYLDPDSGVKAGDLVITSGHDDTFPPGLPIGVVRTVTRPSDGASVSASVDVEVDIDRLARVVVLRP